MLSFPVLHLRPSSPRVVPLSCIIALVAPPHLLVPLRIRLHIHMQGSGHAPVCRHADCPASHMQSLACMCCLHFPFVFFLPPCRPCRLLFFHDAGLCLQCNERSGFSIICLHPPRLFSFCFFFAFNAQCLYSRCIPTPAIILPTLWLHCPHHHMFPAFSSQMRPKSRSKVKKQAFMIPPDFIVCQQSVISRGGDSRQDFSKTMRTGLPRGIHPLDQAANDLRQTLSPRAAASSAGMRPTTPCNHPMHALPASAWDRSPCSHCSHPPLSP